MSKLIKEMLDALNAVNQNKTQPYDRQGEVKRIEGKTAWVKLEGSDRETPIQMTIACDVGDTVQARIGGGSAWLTGNLTAPPTDDKKANEAISMVTNVVQEVQEQVEEALEEATDVEDVTMQYCLSDSSSTFVQYGDWSDTPPEYVSGKYYWTRSVIEDDEGNITYGTPRYSQDTQLTVETDIAFKSNNNHFWHDSSGAYVTTANKNYSSGYATRITSSGILQSYDNNLLSSWTNSGISFYAGDGTTALNSTMLASFGVNNVTLGSTSGNHLVLDAANRTILYFKYGNTYKGYFDGTTLQSYSTLDLVASSGTFVENDLCVKGVLYSGIATRKILTISTVTAAGSEISGGGLQTISTSASRSNYTPIGIIGYEITGTNSQNILPYRMYMNGTTAEARVKNVGSSAITPSVTFHILYIASTQGV